MTDSNTAQRANAGALHSLLSPRSIAVIGASRHSGTMGHQIFHNLIQYGFTGPAYPVNPKADSVCAVRAFPTVSAIPGGVELAVVVVPQAHVFAVAKDCCEAGVTGMIVISAGYREVGETGARNERELAALVRANGVRLLGPNCMGIVNADPAVSMNATFAPTMPPFGQAAFVSQSGALGLSVLDHAREYGIGISQFVSVGNKADVSGNDLLEHWEHDPGVRVILMYVENFGNPRRFLQLASRITKRKPIIVVKSGRSDVGARAATSHTGALAASDAAVDALLTQAGVLRAASVEELFDLAMAFSVRSLPKSRRTAVLTNAGGPGILAADAMDAAGLELVELGADTVKALRPLFPAEASIRNPLDMIASATPAGYTKALSVLLADPAIDAVVPIFVPPFGVRQEDVASAIVAATTSVPGKPAFAVLMGREGLPEGRADLQAAGVPTFVFPESAARALAALSRHVEWTQRPAAVVEPTSGDRVRAAAILATVLREGREQLTQSESMELLESYGVPVVGSRVVTSATEAASAASAVGFPVVLKVVSPDIIHKTEVGGIRLGIANENDVRAAHDELLAAVTAAAPAAKITGVLVQREVAGGTETIVGVSRDPSFGPLVMFGLGGVFVEALRDVVFRLAPLDSTQAADMLAAIRGARVLEGIRGAPPSDRASLARAICAIAQLASDFPQIAELDVNPLLALPDGVLAVDARVRLSVAPTHLPVPAAH